MRDDLGKLLAGATRGPHWRRRLDFMGLRRLRVSSELVENVIMHGFPAVMPLESVPLRIRDITYDHDAGLITLLVSSPAWDGGDNHADYGVKQAPEWCPTWSRDNGTT